MIRFHAALLPAMHFLGSRQVANDINRLSIALPFHTKVWYFCTTEQIFYDPKTAGTNAGNSLEASIKLCLYNLLRMN